MDMRQLARQLKLSDEEYERIVQLLGREPNYTELGIFSAMWSEHCSYKSSRVHLKKFPTESERAIAKPGEENAGALRLKGNWAVVFKIESHNHPSAVEPFQGAATGVGGILRDIFCMGAYPIASLNSLHFGELDLPVVRHLFDGVVRGIASYGNCFGVPTVAGEVRFEKAYAGNPLVNAMAVGIVNTDYMISARAKGVGNPVVYIGAATGRDGIHGASFASGELTESSHEDRPSVQIGDPFTEKLLLEATQEIARKKLAVGMQDMGAAGLTSSSAEMAAKGGVGIELDLDKVPLREEGMTPFEIMLSESQERMLLIAEPENLPEIEKILRKWDLHYAVIGRVIAEQVLRVLWRGEVAAEIPVDALAGDGVPVYDLPQEKPEYLNRLHSRDAAAEIREKLPHEPDIAELLADILAMSTVASKRWVWRQYDHQVGVRTVMTPGADAAVMWIRETGQFLALSTDVNGAYAYLDPYIGGASAVLEGARNVAAVGAKPIGITDCLNFGNPQKPAVMWQFARAVEGISDACRGLGIPVTGGNVSFYNESPYGAIFPTPVVGMVGLIESEEHITPGGFVRAGDPIYLVGETEIREVGGSRLQKLLFGEYFGKPPRAKINEHIKNISFLLTAIRGDLVRSAHDVSDGGIGITLAESVLSGSAGAEINPGVQDPLLLALWLFSESQARFVVSVKSGAEEKFESLAEKFGVSVRKIGRTIPETALIIDGVKIWRETLEEKYEGTIPQQMSK